MTVTNSDKRAILSELEEGPKNHTEIVEATKYDWDELQSIIRELRNEDRVRLRIDRRYEIAD